MTDPGPLAGPALAPCFLCGGGRFQPLVLNRSFGVRILKCLDCAMVQSDPVPDPLLAHYYARHYRPPLDAADIELLDRVTRPQSESQIAYLDSLLGPVRFRAALDYGAAGGSLLDLLAPRADALFATEEDPSLGPHLAARPGLALLKEAELREERFRRFFDLVTLSHVLEHLPDPAEMLALAAVLLRPGGHLLLDLPVELDMLEHGFQAKGHLHYFTTETARRLAVRDDLFEIVDLRRCNRSVQAFIDSGFTLAEDHAIAENPQGTTLRLLLKARDRCLGHADVRRRPTVRGAAFEALEARVAAHFRELERGRDAGSGP